MKGFYVVAQTPFADGGAIDLASIDSLAAFYIEKRITGITALGVSGEAHRLNLDEAVAVTRRFIARAEGRPVILGVSNTSTAHVTDLTSRVMDLGAAGVMIAPPAGLKTEEDIIRYFDDLCGRIVDVPVVLQDFPAASGVTMSVATIDRLARDHPQICAIKHEDFPSLPKLSRLIDTLKTHVPILTGSNAQYLPEELRRGASGPMAGFSFPEVLASIYELHVANDDGLDDIFATFLPLIRYEAQGRWGLAVRKEILRRRGAIASGFMRAPAPQLNRYDMAEIDQLLARIARQSDLVAPSLFA